MKISSFRLAEYFIRKFCSMHKLSFADIDLEFTDTSTPFVRDGCIHLADNIEFKLSQTIYQIVSLYVDNIELISQSEIELKQNYDKVTVSISNDDKTKFLNFILSIIRDMSYGSDDSIQAKTSLNNYPFVWLLMRDIVCPTASRGAKNIDVIAQNTPYVDGARFFNTNEMPGILKPTIVLNSSVTNRAFVLAYLFIEAICAHELHPVDVMHQLLSKAEVKDRFMGLLELISFSDGDSENFLSTLTALTNLEIESHSATKTAQTVNQMWWSIGLIEKMLEPARGSDTTVTDIMADATKELWEKVEAKKSQLGLNTLNLETLLRLQSEEYQNKPNLTLQGLLADVRVW